MTTAPAVVARPGQRRPVGPLGRGLLLVAAAALLFHALTAYSLVPYGVIRPLDDVGLLLGALAGAFGCSRGWRSGHENARQWRLLTVSLLLWAGGQTIWTWAQNVSHDTLPFPSIADVLYILSVAGLSVSAVSSSGASSAVRKLRLCADALLVTSALVFAAWSTVLQGPSRAHELPTAERFWIVAYPLVSLVALGVLAAATSSARRLTRETVTLFAGYLLLVFTTVAYSVLVFSGSYKTGHVIDVLWLIAFGLIGVAGSIATRSGQTAIGPTSESRWVSPAPYAATALSVGAVVVVWARQLPVDGFVVGLGLLVVGSLTARHALALREQRDAADRLAETTRKLDEAQRLAGLGSWDLDLTTRTIDGSAEVLRMFGADPGPITLEAIRSQVHPDDQALIDNAIAEAVAGSGSFAFDYRIIRRDGRERWLEGRGYVRVDSRGRPERIVGTSRDITEQRRAEQAMHEAHARFRAVFHDSSLGLELLTTDGELVEVNEARRAMLALESDGDADGLGTCFDALHPEDRPAMTHALRAVVAGANRTEVEARNTRRDGTVVLVRHALAAILTAQGSVGLVLSATTDVTGARTAEEAARRSKKMEALGTLAGGIAHDFNNVLTAILASTDMLAEDADLPPMARSLADDARQAAERAASLVRRLMAFARQGEHRQTEVVLQAAVDDAAVLLRRTIPETIQIDVSSRGPAAVVRMDPTDLDQVLLNLAVNARDAMPNGGTLRIEVQTGDETADGVARVVVTDTGVGMDADTASRCFDPLFTTKPLGHGTGLGLWTVYGIVERASGTVSVESALGEGTRFTITLPVERPSPTPA